MTAIERADDDLTRLRAQVRFLESELAARDRLIAALRDNCAARAAVIEHLIRTAKTRAVSLPVQEVA